jgi:hypothetical protein
VTLNGAANTQDYWGIQIGDGIAIALIVTDFWLIADSCDYSRASLLKPSMITPPFARCRSETHHHYEQSALPSHRYGETCSRTAVAR